MILYRDNHSLYVGLSSIVLSTFFVPMGFKGTWNDRWVRLQEEHEALKKFNSSTN